MNGRSAPKRLKRRYLPLLLILLILLAIPFCYRQNNQIVVSRHDYAHAAVAAELDGYCIVQVSDLHNKDFGKQLIDKIATEEPDLILITGDLIDRRRSDLETALRFSAQALELAPVYYVSGNHEAALPELTQQLFQRLAEQGVVVLRDQSSPAPGLAASYINLIGLDDPLFARAAYAYGAFPNQLRALRDPARLNILLAHRPEDFSGYTAGGVDLVFSGHAHGGQVRLPGIGGLYAPNQGFFPAYTAGAYSREETTMFVSRGLGNSIFPVRLFNRPELVVVRLRPLPE